MFLRIMRLADAVGADQDGVGALVDEAEGEELLDGFPVDLLGPRPVEVVDRLEGADTGVAEAALEAALLALGSSMLEESREPGLAMDLGPAGEQAVQARAGARGSGRLTGRRISFFFIVGHPLQDWS